ncbi:MAG: 1-(5-phosphoribosyl)-5-[(5-phosphoribosylamino)methylideneamino]imidazole-4-carboxamide isomerase [Gemmatimonadaceae bacterium]|nr:1-(5-phosphoribosyl)-5-[(5-phosphoribosylamino)methylideneamino]imidazole-4-carboxamide isomerase [Gemmatimonadaceae bacterium]
MIAIPAIDLRDGACVQLVGGDYADERVRLDDPVGVAREWVRTGFTRLHVVDLDAATSRGSNAERMRELIANASVPVQVGGGIRTDDAIERWLEAGAAAVVVGTRAVEDMDWLAEMAERWPGSLIVAADVRERRIVTRGWEKTLPLDVLDAVERFNGMPLAGLLVTAVHKEGQMQGTDLSLMEDVAEASVAPVIASGGVTTLGDVRALEHRGVTGAVIGMALYTGALDATALAAQFGASDFGDGVLA